MISSRTQSAMSDDPSASTRVSVQVLIASALCMIWAFLLIAELFTEYRGLAAVSYLIVYGVTLFALRRVAATASAVHIVVRVMSFPVAVLAVFTAWGLLLGRIELLSFFMDFPPWVRVGSLFLAGPLAAAVIVLLFSGPLLALYSRLHWLPIGTVAVLVFALQWDQLLDTDGRSVTRAVMWAEFAWLGIAVPLFVQTLRPVVRRIGLIRGG